MTSNAPVASPKVKVKRKPKVVQPSKLSTRAREAIARAAAYFGGEHPPRVTSDAPNTSTSLEPGDRAVFAEAARRVFGWRQRTLTVISCGCKMCQDGRWVAVDEPAAHDHSVRQHYACTNLKRAGSKPSRPVEE